MDEKKKIEQELRKILEEKYNSLSEEKKLKLNELYFRYSQNKEKYQEELSQLEQAVFKQKPPTGAEFLDPRNGWLHPDIIDSIWPHVREDFLSVIDNGQHFHTLSLYGSTRLGKTFLAQLLIIYTIVFIHHLRSPAMFYGLSPITKLAIYLISFKFDKTRQLYLKDIYAFLENSSRFVKIKFQDKVKSEQQKYGCDKVVWSKAAVSGEITLASGLQILLGNKNPDEIIGTNCLQVYISEITFFINQAGASEEKILEIYTNSYDRIEATVGQDYLTYTFLDASANYTDSLIEKHILKKLRYDPYCYFKWRVRWEVRPSMYKKYYRGLQKLKVTSGIPNLEQKKELLKQGYVFRVITGNGKIPARLVTNDSQLVDVPKKLIDYVPIDLYRQYETNLVKSIKDVGGKPTSNESKFIQNETYIDKLFDDKLKNIEGGIIIDASSPPENLIWPQVEHLFFTKDIQNKNVIYRAKGAPRFISIDTAYSANGDVYGIAMGHLEYSKTLNQKMYILDFAFSFLPGSEGINLSAVYFFIKDLITKGNIYIAEINSDTFESGQIVQDWERMGINVRKQSVDSSLEPYLRLATALMTETVKCGKNIFVKNNLKSLERVTSKTGKEKIEHTEGTTNNKYNGDWENSMVGIHAKDVSDAIANSSFTAFNSEWFPSIIYEDENRKLEIKDTNDEFFQEQLKESYAILRNRY